MDSPNFIRTDLLELFGLIPDPKGGTRLTGDGLGQMTTHVNRLPETTSVFPAVRRTGEKGIDEMQNLRYS